MAGFAGGENLVASEFAGLVENGRPSARDLAGELNGGLYREH